MDVTNLADLYELPPLGWAPIAQRLEQPIPQAPGTGGPDRHTCWLTTINPDGSPHVTGVGGFWHHDAWWFVTGETSRKGRNLARDQRCAMSVSTREFDLVVEGTAELVRDPDQVRFIAETAADDGWPASVDETGTAITAPFSAPSAGPPPWVVYRLQPKRAVGLATLEPGGASRFDF